MQPSSPQLSTNSALISSEPPLPRPDVDIEEEIGQIVRSYPPLQASRIYLHWQVQAGKVKVWGNVRSPQARRYLLDRLPHVAGVTGTDAGALFDDEVLTAAIGEHLAWGIYATVYFGVVALNGTLPANTTVQSIIEMVEAIPGVRRVTAQFDKPTAAAQPGTSL